jgi:hypothetical protein
MVLMVLMVLVAAALLLPAHSPVDQYFGSSHTA